MVSAKPFISQETVRAALDGLIYATKEKNNPLLSLLLIDNFLLNPDLPISAQSREFALSYTLTSLIANEFQRHLSAYNHHPLTAINSRESAIDAIKNIAKYQSAEFVGWTWLYYHYVDIHFNIALQEFCKIAHIDERTLRRYQQFTIKRITDQLIELEWNTRSTQRKRRLYSELPSMGIGTLEGRETEVQRIRRVLAEALPAHIQVTGAAGIGKSALVEVILRELIEDGQIHKVIWLNRPPTLKYVYEFITEQLLPEDSHLSIREYLVIYPTIIVLDDFELNDDNKALASLLQMLKPAKVFITSRLHIALPHLASIPLAEIEEEAAKTLIERTLRNGDSSLSREAIYNYTRLVWEIAGGNALAIQLIASDPNAIYDRPILVRNLSALFERTFYTLDEDARMGWCMLAVMPVGKYSFNEMVETWSSKIPTEVAFKLIRSHVVERTNHASAQIICSLTTAARRYIEHGYSTDQGIKALVNNLLNVDHSIDRLLRVIEHVLTSNWIELEAENRQIWVKQWWRTGVKHQHWSIWRLLLEPYTLSSDVPDLELCVGYGICLRSIGESALAYQIFEKAIVGYGKIGDFLQQAKVFLEMAVVLRYQGEYEKVSALLERAQRVANRFQADDILAAITLEYAQIAVDLKDTKSAPRWLSSLPNTLRGQVLASEIHLLMGDIQESRATAHQLLGQLKDSPSLEARIHTLLGRGYERLYELDKAHEHFLFAVMKLEQQDDIWGLSRAQTNLGAILLKMYAYEEAQMLLSGAERVQILLNDRVGVATTHHNLHLLHVALNS
jgi:tetratricopeptide (TPR) repeat protein